MTKELFVSSFPHETKVAVLEDDQLVEVYFEREADTGLVGGIYKGRVNRVLPGMQSAFVDIGLERDAFLYVSDFVEDEEEYDKIFTDAEARASRFVETGQAPRPEPAAAPVAAAQPLEAAPEPAQPEARAQAQTGEIISPAPSPAEKPAAPPPSGPPSRPQRSSEPGDHRRHESRGRGRFRRGRRDSRPLPRPEPQQEPPSGERSFEVLPGETLAKYRDPGTTQAAYNNPDATAEDAPSSIGQSAPVATLTEGGGNPPTPELVENSSTQSAHIPEDLKEVPPPVEVDTEADRISGVVESESTVIFTPVSVFGAGEPPAAGASSVPEAGPPDSDSSPAAASGVPEGTGPLNSGESESLQESTEATGAPEALPEGSEDEIPQGDLDEPDAQAEGESAGVEAGDTLVPPSAESAAELGGDTQEKKYTLREPHERPRIAPRRRRGRRSVTGRRGSRAESSRAGNQQPVQISDLLKEGQEIIVQIAKEPLGSKGARITSHVALPGRYLVYMPTISHIGVSRKIGSEEERLRLRNIILGNRGPLTGGFIVRTAGAGRSEEEFKTDLRFLSTLWSEIRSKAERLKAPALLHRDLDLVQRIMRDLLSPNFKQVRVDSESDYERCVEFVNHSQPSLVGHVKLYTRNTPMFEEFGIQHEIDQALKPKVWLKSGGYIVINQTEALVAIDVNTGKFVGKTNRLEDTIVKTNIDAINEIVRQIRLRDLGGIIVIDFIDMDERKNRFKVVQALEEALRRDRAPTKVISFNDFGLVAITRKRVKQSLERTLCTPCGYCSGAGWVKSLTTVCYEILAEVKKMASQLEGETITLRVHPDVAQAMKSKQGALLAELEALTHKEIYIKGDPGVHQERFEIY